MPKQKAPQKKQPKDVNQIAHSIVSRISGEDESKEPRPDDSAADKGKPEKR